MRYVVNTLFSSLDFFSIFQWFDAFVTKKNVPNFWLPTTHEEKKERETIGALQDLMYIVSKFHCCTVHNKRPEIGQ